MEWEYKKWELLTGKHTIILVVATVPISATFYCAGERDPAENGAD